MNELISVFTIIFQMLTNNTIFGLSILVWLLIALLFTFIISFIKGKKE